MRKLIPIVLGLGFAAALGCGGSQPPLNTAPLTDEQKAKVKDEDRQTDDAESGGRGGKLGGKPKGKKV
jgi:hypothetical protein